jgi:CelD/BcsL family acetyltransferase involved in cellulose biosynthesis
VEQGNVLTVDLVTPLESATEILGYPRSMQATDHAIHWRFLPISEFGQIASHWQHLAARHLRAPFLSLEFIEPLLRHFSTGAEQVAIGEAEVGIAGLAILTPTARSRRNAFQPSQLPLGPVLLDEGLAVETALESLAQRLPISTLSIGFTQLDESMYPRPASTARLAVGDYIQTAWVDVVGSFADYWEARGKNLRQNIRKQRRKLQEDGVETRLEILRNAACVASAIEDYGRLESSGWKASGGTAIHPDNVQGQFYREMLERFCSEGKGCIYRYSFAGKVVAVDLCIESTETLVVLKTTYDESIKMLSPAFLMREEAFGHIWGEGRIRRIEFFGKLMDWHKRWTDNAREIYHLTNYRWSWIRRLRDRALSAPATVEQVST